MRVQLLYLQGCPHRAEAEARLREALRETGHPNEGVEVIRVDNQVQARRLGFHGSPTILVNGVDPFPIRDATSSQACRLYLTPQGTAGTPSTSQLATALATHL